MENDMKSEVPDKKSSTLHDVFGIVIFLLVMASAALAGLSVKLYSKNLLLQNQMDGLRHQLVDHIDLARKGLFEGLGLGFDGSSLTVTDVYPHTPAADAGFRVGDTIVAVGPRKIFLVDDLRAICNSASLDHPLDVVVQRNDRVIHLKPTPKLLKLAPSVAQ
ncbi:PDZ domain-containing protein [Patescibacteria group bacterium]|nr:PDZ domain-containing protein [Patescibacteria group bacterium]